MHVEQRLQADLVDPLSAERTEFGWLASCGPCDVATGTRTVAVPVGRSRCLVPGCAPCA